VIGGFQKDSIKASADFATGSILKNYISCPVALNSEALGTQEAATEAGM